MSIVTLFWNLKSYQVFKKIWFTPIKTTQVSFYLSGLIMTVNVISYWCHSVYLL